MEIPYLVLQTSIVFDFINFCLFITLAIPHHGRAASTPRNDSDEAYEQRKVPEASMTLEPMHLPGIKGGKHRAPHMYFLNLLFALFHEATRTTVRIPRPFDTTAAGDGRKAASSGDDDPRFWPTTSDGSDLRFVGAYANFRRGSASVAVLPTMFLVVFRVCSLYWHESSSRVGQPYESGA